MLLFLDVGGSMEDHVRVCEELFSAARSEFKHLEYFYFHNFVYESVWKDNRRRHREKIPTMEVMRTYGHDYKLIFVGDATMSPYEIVQPGGSVEHWNEEAGAVWMQRLAARGRTTSGSIPNRSSAGSTRPQCRSRANWWKTGCIPLTLRRAGSGDQGAALRRARGARRLASG